MTFEELLQGWDGEEAVVRFDRPSGVWIFVCIHSTARGPAGGGTRLRVYPRPADGLADAMRLSGAMTRKLAMAQLPFGGGKGVLAVPELPDGERRRELLLRYGDVLAALGATFRTAGDMNIGPADLDVIAERAPHVYGRSVGRGGGGDSGVGTARGVFHGIRACLEYVFGAPDPAERSVLVQGVGSVGRPLARLLADARARVLVSDVAESAAQRVAEEVGAEVVSPAEAIGTSCDVYAPCAVGGTLNADTIPRLRCRIVAGSANNQLATPADGDRLAAAGILYAPDYVINIGGVLQLLGLEDLGWDGAALEENLARIGATLAEVFAAAEADGVTPAAAAEHLALERMRG